MTLTKLAVLLSLLWMIFLGFALPAMGATGSLLEIIFLFIGPPVVVITLARIIGWLSPRR